MPEISRFFGIIIYMYFADHAPPHFHARYGSKEALFDIQTLSMIHGNLSPRVRALVVEWAAKHQFELMENWKKLQKNKSPKKIKPLE